MMKAVAFMMAFICFFVGVAGTQSQTDTGRRGALVFLIFAAIFGGFAWHL